jgi:hypothetical protein
MGHNPKNLRDEPRRGQPGRVDVHPQDPRTNTRPRGNGSLDGREADRSARKLEMVLGH